jgi:hypothetical protein
MAQRFGRNASDEMNGQILRLFPAYTRAPMPVGGKSLADSVATSQIPTARADQKFQHFCASRHLRRLWIVVIKACV